MKQIKFNLWDIDKSTYFRDVLSLENDKIRKWGSLENRTSNNVKWLRFTGLKDKHDKEIYEGDILKITLYDDEWKTKVRDYLGTLVIDVEGCDWNTTALSFLDDEAETEVIGNIFENPELI